MLQAVYAPQQGEPVCYVGPTPSPDGFVSLYNFDPGGSAAPLRRVEIHGQWCILRDLAACRVVAGWGEGEWSVDTVIARELVENWVLERTG